MLGRVLEQSTQVRSKLQGQDKNNMCNFVIFKYKMLMSNLYHCLPNDVYSSFQNLDCRA